MGELLKEAIADAKAIRDTALANAKMALEEAFAPQLEKMISDKIHNEVMYDEHEGEEEVPEPHAEPDGDEMPAAEPAPVDVAVEPEAGAEGGETPEVNIEVEPEGGEEGEEEEMPELQEGGAGTKVTADADADPEKAKGSKSTHVTLHEEEEETDDLDLESIIRELEEQAEEDEEEDEEDVDEVVQFGGKVTTDAGNDPEGQKATNMPYKKGGKYDKKPVSEGEEEVDEAKKEVDEKFKKGQQPPWLKKGEKKEKKDVDEKIEKWPSRRGALPNGAPTEGYEEGEEEVAEKIGKVKYSEPPINKIYVNEEGEEEGDEEIDLDEILRELESEEAVDERHPEEMGAEEEEGGEDEMATEMAGLREKLQSTYAELEEHRKVVSFLKTKLNEVNLLNAKLLFTNKLFKGHVLNNAQKMKVIESFDRTKTLREVKLVYATMAESFSQTDAAKKSGRVIGKITEGIASKAQKSTKPAVEKVVKQSSIIDDGSAERLKKLAGIIK